MNQSGFRQPRCKYSQKQISATLLSICKAQNIISWFPLVRVFVITVCRINHTIFLDYILSVWLNRTAHKKAIFLFIKDDRNR